MPTLPLGSETDRLAALMRYAVLDTPPEEDFERITSLAAHLFGMPVARISFVDETRVWFKSSYGTPAITSPASTRPARRLILAEEVFIVPDAAADLRFCQDPLVANDPHGRFYAGAPLRTADGFNLGALGLIDFVPREFDAIQQKSLKQLAAVVVGTL